MNIYDIARKSGVSIATVSRVLNGNPNVRAQTRERVLAVIAQEGYTPNAFARGLGSGSTQAVGVLCADMSDPLCAEAFGCVETYLRQNGLDAVVRAADGQPAEERRALDYLLSKKVEVIVLIGSLLCGGEDVSALADAAAQMPLILVDGYAPYENVYSVAADSSGAMEQLIHELFRCHKRRVLFLYDSLTYSCRQKLAGYRAGYEKNGETADDALVVAVERRPEAVNDCMKRLLVRGVSFDAVVAAEDVLAVGAQKALGRIGLKVPAIGFNDSLVARCATPELTSVAVDVAALCDTAMAHLQMLLGKETPPTHTVVPTRLVERDSFRLA